MITNLDWGNVIYNFFVVILLQQYRIFILIAKLSNLKFNKSCMSLGYANCKRVDEATILSF